MQQVERQLQAFADKFVVKPLRQGSSVGISIADAVDQAIIAAQRCLSDFGDCMIEEFVPGREITVGILKDQALPVIEIRSETGFYDFRAKYLDERTQFLFDTIDDRLLISKINAAALDCFNALGCRHFARVDFILGDDGELYALEVNTIPGFTSHSLLPKAAEKAEISMSDLCRRIVEAALANNTTEPFVDTAMNSRR
jgi:D-alanine-D-alanine ligase